MDRTTHATLRQAAIALTALTATVVPPAWAAETDSRTANPVGGGGSVILEPVPASRVQRKQRTVFVCTQDGTPVFSDRPCGPAGETREFDVAEAGPGKAPTTFRVEPKASTRPLVRRAALETPRSAGDNRCKTLHEQLDAIDDRMRAGYSAREAARLWNRWRDLKAKIHASRC